MTEKDSANRLHWQHCVTDNFQSDKITSESPYCDKATYTQDFENTYVKERAKKYDDKWEGCEL